jgi:hypothetical protein
VQSNLFKLLFLLLRLCGVCSNCFVLSPSSISLPLTNAKFNFQPNDVGLLGDICSVAGRGIL